MPNGNKKPKVVPDFFEPRSSTLRDEKEMPAEIRYVILRGDPKNSLASDKENDDVKSADQNTFSNTPLDRFFKVEKEAFDYAKTIFSQHPFCIFQLFIPRDPSTDHSLLKIMDFVTGAKSYSQTDDFDSGEDVLNIVRPARNPSPK